jgi:hypothetical protein
MNIREPLYAWRWTDPRMLNSHGKFSLKLSPLDTGTAAALHDRWIQYFDKHGELIPSRFECIETCPMEGTVKGDACSREMPLMIRAVQRRPPHAPR